MDFGTISEGGTYWAFSHCVRFYICDVNCFFRLLLLRMRNVHGATCCYMLRRHQHVEHVRVPGAWASYAQCTDATVQVTSHMWHARP